MFGRNSEKAAVALNVEAGKALRNVKSGLRGASPELKREFYKALNRATKPLKVAAKANAPKVLPRRGGLGAAIGKSTMSTQHLASQGRISIAAKGRKQVALIDSGTVRHPLYGNRKVWIAQPVKPGWFTKPMEAGAPMVRKELMQALNHAAAEIAKHTAT